MQRKTLTLLFCLFIIKLNAQTQVEYVSSSVEKDPRISLVVDAGTRFFEQKNQNYSFIRKEAYHYYDYHNSFSKLSFAPYLALRCEVKILSDKFWFSTGISYSQFNAIIDSPNGHLYAMLNSTEDVTHYYRVNNIREQNEYIGIPVDLRFSPFLGHFFCIYFKAGFRVNYMLESTQKVSFFDPNMTKYQEDIIDLLDKPDPFYATACVGVGIQIGKPQKPKLRLEGDLPTVIFNSNAFGLFDQKLGAGVRLSLIIPIKDK